MNSRIAIFYCAMLTLLSETSLLASQEQQLIQHDRLAAFTAEYQLYRKAEPVGKSVRQLEYLDDRTARLRYEMHAEWFVFSDLRTETSELRIDKGTIRPLHYKFERSGTGRDRSDEWRYDVPGNRAEDVANKKQMTIDFPDAVQDKVSYHLQMRLNLMANPEQPSFIFPVIGTSGTIKEYRFDYDGFEALDLPYGSITAIRYKRQVDDKKRITYAWFAPELDYLLVKLSQFKKGKEQYDIQLSNFVTTEESPEITQEDKPN